MHRRPALALASALATSHSPGEPQRRLKSRCCGALLQSQPEVSIQILHHQNDSPPEQEHHSPQFDDARMVERRHRMNASLLRTGDGNGRLAKKGGSSQARRGFNVIGTNRDAIFSHPPAPSRRSKRYAALSGPIGEPGSPARTTSGKGARSVATWSAASSSVSSSWLSLAHRRKTRPPQNRRCNQEEEVESGESARLGV